jgi:hypothetical protein
MRRLGGLCLLLVGFAAAAMFPALAAVPALVVLAAAAALLAL